jgi:hypothetical protein
VKAINNIRKKQNIIREKLKISIMQSTGGIMSTTKNKLADTLMAHTFNMRQEYISHTHVNRTIFAQYITTNIFRQL